MVQLLVEGGEPERNLDRADALVAEASARGADIVLLPECLDLAWTHPSCLTEAQPIPGPISDRLSGMAQEYGVYICCGLTEYEDGKVYNTALLIDDGGAILHKYRKINVLAVAHDMYAVGQSLGVVDTKFGRIGVNICSDNYDDALDIGFVLARMGAQIILSPSSWTVDYSVTEEQDPYGEKWLKPYRTLAGLFDIVVVNATSVGTIVGGPYEGKKMMGCSLAVGPDGLLAQGDFNEFASDLTMVEFDVPAGAPRGTDFGELLREHNATAGLS